MDIATALAAFLLLPVLLATLGAGANVIGAAEDPFPAEMLKFKQYWIRWFAAAFVGCALIFGTSLLLG